MKKILFTLTVLLLATSFLYASEEMTEVELYDEIKDIIESEPDILEYIPELKASFDENGQIVKIEYKIKEISRDIKELDKETLINIFNRACSERTRIITERMTRQLEIINRSRIPQAPAAPPIPPRVPTPPPAPPRMPERR